MKGVNQAVSAGFVFRPNGVSRNEGFGLVKGHHQASKTADAFVCCCKNASLM